jgi:hypothetical protein
MAMTCKPANKDRMDRAFEEYLSKPQPIRNERLREDGKSFSEAMCEVSIASGLKDGEAILDTIKKAGR